MNTSAGRWTTRFCSGGSRTLPLRQGMRARINTAGHQRRKSSSSTKPPKAGDGLVEPVGQKPKATKTQVLSPAPQAQMLTSERKRRSLVEATPEQDNQLPTQLPNVPSTSHLHPADIAVSSFFSEHRPISITSSIPDSDTNTVFQKIFSKRTRVKPAQIIDVLSGVASSMENSVAAAEHEAIDQAPDPQELRLVVDQVPVRDILNKHYHHNSAPPTSDALTRSNYQPFQPPSAPVPQKTDFTPVLAAPQPITTGQTAYRMTIRVIEKLHPSGTKSINFRMSAVENDPEPSEMDAADPTDIVNYTLDVPSTFLSRMQGRQEASIERLMAKMTTLPPQMLARLAIPQSGMLAISVKRQRKLKMKKHKHKKLMKKTRSLRKRIERG